MTDRLAIYARRAVPRYTSYPTAPNFQAGFPAATYAGWLGALDPAAPISLYIHVPFCKQICWYCGCNMRLAVRAAPVTSYVATLLREVELVAGHLPARMPVSHLHWGGGTPTSIAPAQLAEIMACIRSRFEVLATAELAIETDPRTLSDAMVAEIGALGFTRASFGVQEFDPRVQAAINRIQPPELVASAVSRLRKAGIAGINFDLIYGLPHQTVGTLLRTIEIAAAMRPERVALFGYAHVPWKAKAQRLIDAAALPDETARAEQAAAAGAALQAAGYVAIGIDHYALADDGLARAARQGRLRRNFQGYTDDPAETLLGLGASAIGKTPWGYVQSIAEPGAWARAVGEGRLPVAKGRVLEPEDRLRAHVIERIMCDGFVDLAAAGAAFGAAPDWWAGAREALGELAEYGLLVLEGPRLQLTDFGRPLARVCAAVFDRYLVPSATRHSAAL